MNKIWTLSIVIIIGIVLLSGISCAISYSDEDNDGANEVGETITFVGDDSYIDSNSVEHPFTSWYWDFESDDVIDDYGKIVTHTFDEQGTFVVTVYEVGDLNLLIRFQLTVVIPLPEVEDPTLEEILQQAGEDIDELLENTINDEYDNDYHNKFDGKANAEKNKDINHLSLSSLIIDNELDPVGDETLLPLEAIKLLVKNLQKVDKRGIIDTVDIMATLTDLLVEKVEQAIIDAEAEYGPENDHVKEAWKKFDKGLDKVEEAKYDRAVDEFIRAYRELDKL